MNFEVVEWLENDITSFHVVGAGGRCYEVCKTEPEAVAKAASLTVEYERVLTIL